MLLSHRTFPYVILATIGSFLVLYILLYSENNAFIDSTSRPIQERKDTHILEVGNGGQNGVGSETRGYRAPIGQERETEEAMAKQVIEMMKEKEEGKEATKESEDTSDETEAKPESQVSNGRPRYTVPESPWIVRQSTQRESTVVQQGVKYVAVYDDPEELRVTELSGSKEFDKCTYNKCTMTRNFSMADLVRFNGRVLLHYPIQKFWHRPPHQRWVIKLVDPLVHNFGLNNDSLRSQFNWTSSYRIDNDVPNLMGVISPKPHPIQPRNYSELFHRKTKLAAWFVSHCDTWSFRELYVQRMSKIAPVDIYGRCGPYKCGERHGRMQHDLPECFPLLTNNYKFYFAFENAFCIDYISEKFFKLFVDVQIIPVVRGGLDYNNAFPKGTFVNAADFATPEGLMRYLVRLGNDETAYVNMLKEKDRWYLNEEPEQELWCKMCKKLHTDTNVGHYEDLDKTFNSNPNECWSPQDLGPKYSSMDLNDIIEANTRPRR